MNRDDDPTNNPLASVDLHAWRVPPAASTDRAELLTRALSPARPPRRSRVHWMFGVALGVNVLAAAIIAIIVTRPPRTVVVRLPAGGPSHDAQLESLLQRLDAQIAEVERRRAELDMMRSTVVDLESRLAHCEKSATVAKPPGVRDDLRKNTGCDEVSCVLNNHRDKCCARFLRPAPPAPVAPVAPQLSEGLERGMISGAIQAVRGAVASCGDSNPVNGVVKVRVNVEPSGRITNVVVERTPDGSLGDCVAAAIQRAVFPATKLGGSFSYPFVF